MHREGTNPTYRSSYGSWISSKMYSCGSCFLWSCFSSQNYRWSSCKTEVRLRSCVAVGLTSGTTVKETDYRQTPTSPTARWLRKQEGEEMVVAWTPRKLVSDGTRVGGVCRTSRRECCPCHPTISRYIEQISSCPCSALLYLSSQPASGRAEPIVCLLTCGPTCQ